MLKGLEISIGPMLIVHDNSLGLRCAIPCWHRNCKQKQQKQNAKLKSVTEAGPRQVPSAAKKFHDKYKFVQVRCCRTAFWTTLFHNGLIGVSMRRKRLKAACSVSRWINRSSCFGVLTPALDHPSLLRARCVSVSFGRPEEWDR